MIYTQQYIAPSKERMKVVETWYVQCIKKPPMKGVFQYFFRVVCYLLDEDTVASQAFLVVCFVIGSKVHILLDQIHV